MSVTFITGNQHKADYLAQYLGEPVAHQKIDVDEIQSLHLADIVNHKARQAYAAVQSPVLVEDVSLEIEALGGLPGPFVKWFLQAMTPQQICDLLHNKPHRRAVGKVMFGYFDGHNMRHFESALKGHIADAPAGDGGFGWDSIFIPEGYEVTRAQLNADDYQKVYSQIRPLAKLKTFLEQL